MELLEKTKERRNLLDIIIRVLLIAVVVFVFVALVKWAQADIGRSIHDGIWTVRYTNCQGQLTVYEHATVTDSGEVWLTITWDNGQREIKLPIHSLCAEMILERER